MRTPLSDARPLFLGSGSPRRREILSTLRIPFVVAAAEADESVAEGEAAERYLERVVEAKLQAVRARVRVGLAAAEHVGERVILVADTSVVDGATILGKPASPDDGRAMLERLAGRSHAVMTRFALATVGLADGEGGDGRDGRDGRAVLLHAETVTTRVTFRALGPAEIAAYVRRGEGVDKAGGYAVQGLGSGFVARLEGSYANVVGLPACELVVALAALGLATPAG